MLLLIDCKIELGKRPDVKKKFKVVSLEPGGHEEEAMLAENYTNKVNGQSTRSENSNGDVQSKDTEVSVSVISLPSWGSGWGWGLGSSLESLKGEGI